MGKRIVTNKYDENDDNFSNKILNSFQEIWKLNSFQLKPLSTCCRQFCPWSRRTFQYSGTSRAKQVHENIKFCVVLYCSARAYTLSNNSTIRYMPVLNRLYL
jgi:hypothetical protein